jgi:hypothetical protein
MARSAIHHGHRRQPILIEFHIGIAADKSDFIVWYPVKA